MFHRLIVRLGHVLEIPDVPDTLGLPVVLVLVTREKSNGTTHWGLSLEDSRDEHAQLRLGPKNCHGLR